MSTEIWAPIPGYSNYEVSSLGRVNSLNYIKEGKPREMKIGSKRRYHYVKLYNKGVHKIFYVHQLVAMAFLGHVPNGNTMEVDHIDENKSNNRLENLQIISSRANISKSCAKNRALPTGVNYDKARNKYRARIKIGDKQKFLGRFDTPEEASEVYQKALREII